MAKNLNKIFKMLALGVFLSIAGCSGEPEVVLQELPEWFPGQPVSPEFAVQRKDSGAFPQPGDVDQFTDAYASFLKQTDFVGWIDRHAQGLAPDNPWGLPDYKIWWYDAFMTRKNDLVTLSFRRAPDIQPESRNIAAGQQAPAGGL